MPSARLGPGRKPAFGPYRVTDTRRGWATTRQPPLNRRRPDPTGLLGSPVLHVPAQPAGRRLQTEDYQLQFHFRNQAAPAQQATAYCTVHRSTQLVVSQAPLLGQVDPELRRRTTETFQARLVGPPLGATTAWDLVLVTTPRSGVERDNPTPIIGVVGQGDQVLLRIRLVAPPAPAGKSLRQQLAPLRGPKGAEILHQGQRIAYVDYETVAADLSLAIWLRDDLEPHLRFLTATTIAALLVQANEPQP